MHAPLLSWWGNDKFNPRHVCLLRCFWNRPPLACQSTRFILLVVLVGHHLGFASALKNSVHLSTHYKTVVLGPTHNFLNPYISVSQSKASTKRVDPPHLYQKHEGDLQQQALSGFLLSYFPKKNKKCGPGTAGTTASCSAEDGFALAAGCCQIQFLQEG